ncbi:MAG: hypothetical protein ACSHW0_04510 [Thalassotalea sp.]
MAKINSQDSHFTSEVRHLINRISDRTIQKDSVFDRATEFYKQNLSIQEQLNTYQQEIASLNIQSASVAAAKTTALKTEIDKLELSQEMYHFELKAESELRHKHLLAICNLLIDLCEGENFEETLRKSAQFLGTIQLISPNEGKNIAVVNDQHKAIYKAVLCLRLLDELILSEHLNDAYVNKYLEGYSGNRYRHFQLNNPESYKVFTEQIKVAIVMSALLQDIGNHHPEAQKILTGGGTEDPYRALTIEERKSLLQISFRETNRYIVDGLGTLKYTGNSRDEKRLFIERESEKILFIRQLLKNAINPKKGIGNLLKVPQIYTSIIMSTKANYNYKVLPKVYNVLNLNAERGACQQSVVDSLYKITGMFPQGYGVTFIPKADDGSDMDYYEYGVVSQFYPKTPEEPLCRQATKNLAFISFGHDLSIGKKSNLYFQDTAKRFSRVSKARLLEILAQMASNFEERKNLDILPRCWLPNDYFSVKNHQKLWNRSVNSLLTPMK